jgi:hypothetical protein
MWHGYQHTLIPQLLADVTSGCPFYLAQLILPEMTAKMTFETAVVAIFAQLHFL